MSLPVISVQGLGKRYQIGHAVAHDTLRDTLAHGLGGMWKRWRAGRAGESEDFWALRDVGFDVAPGEVMGIIGRNGAGKSTLLKILSRITEPTVGRVTLRGRVASLLEVGTGFHPELSGRENIFLNGAILGMTRLEISRKFDEIVAFAEIDRFLDTPVKHYSSGMYVRLAFAVAAHLEPEILIVDEVLAVGDAAFQKKCLGKMQEVATGHGRTVLFVSHNSAALLNICRTGLWLQDGRVMHRGPIGETVSTYLQSNSRLGSQFTAATDRPHITSVQVDQQALAAGRLVISVGFASPFPLNPPVVGVILNGKLGQPIGGANGRMAGAAWAPPAAKSGVITATVDALPLHSDSYSASIWLGDAVQDYDERRNAVEFDFVSPRFYPQAPSIEVMGAVDFSWRWSFAAKS